MRGVIAREAMIATSDVTPPIALTSEAWLVACTLANNNSYTYTLYDLITLVELVE